MEDVGQLSRILIRNVQWFLLRLSCIEKFMSFDSLRMAAVCRIMLWFGLVRDSAAVAVCRSNILSHSASRNVGSFALIVYSGSTLCWWLRRLKARKIQGKLRCTCCLVCLGLYHFVLEYVALLDGSSHVVMI